MKDEKRDRAKQKRNNKGQDDRTRKGKKKQEERGNEGKKNIEKTDRRGKYATKGKTDKKSTENGIR